MLVLYGDTPRLRPETVRALVELHRAGRAAATLLTARLGDPTGYGRIVRDTAVGGRAPEGLAGVRAIVEEKAALPEERAITEVNAGVYCVAAAALREHLPALPRSPQGEYYLTDLIAALARAGETVTTHVTDDPAEAEGINDRVQLAAAESVLRQRIRVRVMRSGVTMLDPASTFVDDQVSIGQDTIIGPFCVIEGETTIGPDCRIGPHAHLRNATIGAGCTVLASTIEDAALEDGVDVARTATCVTARFWPPAYTWATSPKSSDPRGARQQDGAFQLPGRRHLGEHVNVGAGTITCNYDGTKKNPTTIADDVFLGSDTMLVAPVTLGEGARNRRRLRRHARRARAHARRRRAGPGRNPWSKVRVGPRRAAGGLGSLGQGRAASHRQPAATNRGPRTKDQGQGAVVNTLSLEVIILVTRVGDHRTRLRG